MEGAMCEQWDLMDCVTVYRERVATMRSAQEIALTVTEHRKRNLDRSEGRCLQQLFQYIVF